MCLLPLTGQSESVGRRQLQLVSCQNLEHSEQILSRPPEEEEEEEDSKALLQLDQTQVKRNACICIFKLKYTDATNNPKSVFTCYPFIDKRARKRAGLCHLPVR